MTAHYPVQPLEFDDVCDLLVELGSIISAAEFHGCVSGMLAGCIKDKKEPDGGWAKFMAATIDVECKAELLQQQELVEIGQHIANELTSEDLSFQLLLPDDDDDINMRIEALGSWCHGFLSGFAQSGITDKTLRLWPADAREALHDLAAIAHIGHDSSDASDAESDYVDVSEYVRLAALHVFLECVGDDNKGAQDMASADDHANNNDFDAQIASVSDLFARNTKPLH